MRIVGMICMMSGYAAVGNMLFYHIGGTYVTVADVIVMLMSILVCNYIALRIISLRK